MIINNIKSLILNKNIIKSYFCIYLNKSSYNDIIDERLINELEYKYDEYDKKIFDTNIKDKNNDNISLNKIEDYYNKPIYD